MAPEKKPGLKEAALKFLETILDVKRPLRSQGNESLTSVSDIKEFLWTYLKHDEVTLVLSDLIAYATKQGKSDKANELTKLLNKHVDMPVTQLNDRDAEHIAQEIEKLDRYRSLPLFTDVIISISKGQKGSLHPLKSNKSLVSEGIAMLKKIHAMKKFELELYKNPGFRESMKDMNKGLMDIITQGDETPHTTEEVMARGRELGRSPGEFGRCDDRVCNAANAHADRTSSARKTLAALVPLQQALGIAGRGKN